MCYIGVMKTWYIYGAGPSLSLAGEYRGLLSNFSSIGVNRSILYISPGTWIFADRPAWSLYGVAYRRLRRRGRIGILCHEQCRGMRGLPRDTVYAKTYKSEVSGGPLSLSLSDGLLWSLTSALAASNYAYLKGAGRIVLLGVDLHGGSYFDGTPVAHDFGSDGHAEIIVEKFARMGDYLREKGVDCVNCSPDSLVASWRYEDLGSVLNEIKHVKSQV